MIYNPIKCLIQASFCRFVLCARTAICKDNKNVDLLLINFLDFVGGLVVLFFVCINIFNVFQIADF